MVKRQKGFGVIEGIILVFVLLALTGGGWYIWQKRNQDRLPTTDSPKTVDYDDACTLVSKAEVEVAFDSTFKDFFSEKSLGYSNAEKTTTCSIYEQHERTASGALGFLSLQIIAERYSTEDAAIKQLDLVKHATTLNGQELRVRTDVSGVGDEAFFLKDRTTIGEEQEYLYVRNGDHIFHFIAMKFNGIDPEKTRPPLIELAKKALE